MSGDLVEFRSVAVKIGMAVGAALLVAGCASPKVVQSVQPADSQLACEGLQKELDEAEKLRAGAEGSLGSTGGQIVTGMLFFPALLVSHENRTNALNAAEARKAHLAGLMSERKCAAAPPPKEPAKKGK